MFLRKLAAASNTTAVTNVVDGEETDGDVMRGGLLDGDVEYEIGSGNSTNTTGIFIVEDEGLVEPELAVGYTDVQTVFIACVATLLLLIFTLVTALCIRAVWQKFREQGDEGYRGVLQGDESTDPLAGKSQSTSGHHLSDELKISESQFSLGPLDDVDDLPPANLSSSVQNHSGSVITMTLKNNHLIVETEERPMPENARSSTRITASSSPSHSVFVVEVQHTSIEPGAASYRPKLAPHAHAHEDFDEIDEEIDEDGRRSTSQRALVHHPPDEDLDDVIEEAEQNGGSTNTGLSQSDLSISSAGSNNPSYSYGNQLGYGGGQFGYPQYVGYIDDAAPTEETGDVVLNSQSVNSMTTPLLEVNDEEDAHLSEQVKLGNGVDKDVPHSNGYDVKKAVRIEGGEEKSRATLPNIVDVELKAVLPKVGVLTNAALDEIVSVEEVQQAVVEKS